MKCYRYLNVEPGTMNPQEHGKVFVPEYGTEVDIDFGHYESSLDCQASRNSNLASGEVFKSSLETPIPLFFAFVEAAADGI